MKELSTTQSTNNILVQGSDTISLPEFESIMSEIEKLKTQLTSDNSTMEQSYFNQCSTPFLSRIKKLHDSGSISEENLEPKELFPVTPNTSQIRFSTRKCFQVSMI